MNIIEAIVAVTAFTVIIAVAVISGMNIIHAITTVIGVGILTLLLDFINLRYLLRKLKKANAISPEKALTLKEAKLESGPLTEPYLARLIKRKKVNITEDGRYYVESKDEKPG
jgi:hypothetical protein